jgi:hypothetical protein
MVEPNLGLSIGKELAPKLNVFSFISLKRGDVHNPLNKLFQFCASASASVIATV